MEAKTTEIIERTYKLDKRDAKIFSFVFELFIGIELILVRKLRSLSNSSFSGYLLILVLFYIFIINCIITLKFRLGE